MVKLLEQINLEVANLEAKDSVLANEVDDIAKQLESMNLEQSDIQGKQTSALADLQAAEAKAQAATQEVRTL